MVLYLAGSPALQLTAREVHSLLAHAQGLASLILDPCEAHRLRIMDWVALGRDYPCLQLEDYPWLQLDA